MGNIFPFENNHGNFNLKATKHIIYIIWGKFHWAKQGFIEAVRLNKTNTRKGSQNLIIFLELAFPFSVKYQKEFLFFSFWKSFSSQQLKIYYWSDCQSVRRAFNTAGVEGWVGDFAFQTIIKSKTFKQSKKPKQKIQTNIKSRGWRILICQTIKEGKKTSEIEIWEDFFLSGMTSSYFKDLYMLGCTLVSNHQNLPFPLLPLWRLT